MPNLHKEIIHTQNKHVSCNGLEAPYDHPMIYLEIDIKEGKAECPYCSRVFALDKTVHNK